ncbi:MAG: LemA family protein [Bacteroides sp.]|nr:LemA family protein [Bacteroides sp.]
MDKNKEIWIVAGILFVLHFFNFLWLNSHYNTMVTYEESVQAAWSQVENQYQRRADLIPNLVALFERYAAHEMKAFEEVAEARTRAASVRIDSEVPTEETLRQYQSVQVELSTAVSRMMVISEEYPDLKANKAFEELNVQLEGTENRIAVERKRFNEASRTYNTYLRRFPNRLLGKLFGFSPQAYFTADIGSEKAPAIKF